MTCSSCSTPEAPGGASSAIVEQVKSQIDSGGATLKGDADWGMRRLSYEIDHRREAQYHLFQFEGTKEVLTQLDRSLSIDDSVLRHRIIRLSGAPETTPKAPEEAPRRSSEDRGGAARAAGAGASPSPPPRARRPPRRRRRQHRKPRRRPDQRRRPEPDQMPDRPLPSRSQKQPPHRLPRASPRRPRSAPPSRRPTSPPEPAFGRHRAALQKSLRVCGNEAAQGGLIRP